MVKSSLIVLLQKLDQVYRQTTVSTEVEDDVKLSQGTEKTAGTDVYPTRPTEFRAGRKLTICTNLVAKAVKPYK